MKWSVTCSDMFVGSCSKIQIQFITLINEFAVLLSDCSRCSTFCFLLRVTLHSKRHKILYTEKNEFEECQNSFKKTCVTTLSKTSKNYGFYFEWRLGRLRCETFQMQPIYPVGLLIWVVQAKPDTRMVSRWCNPPLIITPRCNYSECANWNSDMC